MRTCFETDAALNRLDASLSKMIYELGAVDAVLTFTAAGEEIRKQAAPHDRSHVTARVQQMLHQAGLIQKR